LPSFAAGKAGPRVAQHRVCEGKNSPLYRNQVFAEIKPATRTRIDFGLALGDTKAADGLVVDPFAGSGTTLAATVACGRRALGCDIRESQVGLARRRLTEDVA
jgi:hypothetical protein